MKRYAWIFVRTLLYGLGAYLVANYVVNRNSNRFPGNVPGSDPVSSSQDSSSSLETASLRREILELNGNVGKLRRQMVANGEPTHAAGQPNAENPPLPRSPTAIAEQERRWSEHIATVKAAFQREARNPEWASSTSDRIRTTFDANEGMRGTFSDIECHSQTCKVEVLDDHSGGVSKNLPIVISQLGELFPSTQADHVEQGDGRMMLTIYMTRGDFPN